MDHMLVFPLYILFSWWVMVTRGIRGWWSVYVCHACHDYQKVCVWGVCGGVDVVCGTISCLNSVILACEQEQREGKQQLRENQSHWNSTYTVGRWKKRKSFYYLFALGSKYRPIHMSLALQLMRRHYCRSEGIFFSFDHSCIVDFLSPPPASQWRATGWHSGQAHGSHSECLPSMTTC